MNVDYVEAFLWSIATYFSMRAAVMIWVNRSETNVYWPGWAFYAIYETWKFVYYDHFDQWFSVTVNTVMVSTNFVALGGVFRVRGYWPFRRDDV